MKKKKNYPLIIFLWAIFIFGFLFPIILFIPQYVITRNGEGGYCEPANWLQVSAPHEVAGSSGMVLSWQIDHVYAYNKDRETFMIPYQGKLFIFGSLQPRCAPRFLGFDENTGAIKVQTQQIFSVSSFIVHQSKIIYGSGENRLFILDYEKNITQQSDYVMDKLPCCLDIQYEKLYSYWYNQELIVFNPNSFRIVQTVPQALGPIVRVEGNLAFITPDEKKIQALPFSQISPKNTVEFEKIEMTWQTRFDTPYFLLPIFTDTAIYVRTGAQIGALYAIDKATGAIRWQTEANVISNISASNDMVFFLTKDGSLNGVDAKTGKRNVFAQFSSPSLPPAAWARGYEVAFDPVSGQVFALLGDSTQLFAFNVLQ
jgi:outer membrane protein assembly factor BamB